MPRTKLERACGHVRFLMLQAFDGQTSTKWLDFTAGSTGEKAWIEYRMANDAAPLVTTSFALTSANDFPDRDPCDVILEGKASHGDATWQMLADCKGGNGVTFMGRFQKVELPAASAVACRVWRLRIEGLKGKGVNCTQLAGFEIYGYEPREL